MHGYCTKRYALHLDAMKQRVLRAANLLISTDGTIRSVAKAMGVSKTTTHMDLTDRLHRYDPELASVVREHLDRNAELRAVRGGEATRLRFLLVKSQA